MCFGGGGNKAADAANAAERERQASIANTQGRVNQIFNDPNRKGEIDDYVGALREYWGEDLSRQKADTDRNLRFALARGGLTGGSTQRDQSKLFGEQYARGVLDVEQRALGAGAELEAADQDARARLISLATSGLDATTAAQQAAAAMRTNLEAGKATSRVQQIGDIFGSFKQFADQSRDAQQRRQALYDGGRNLYGPSAATAFNYGGGP